MSGRAALDGSSAPRAARAARLRREREELGIRRDGARIVHRDNAQRQELLAEIDERPPDGRIVGSRNTAHDQLAGVLEDDALGGAPGGPSADPARPAPGPGLQAGP